MEGGRRKREGDTERVNGEGWKVINNEKGKNERKNVKIHGKERKNQRREGNLASQKEKQEEEITRLLTRKHRQRRRARAMTEGALGADHLATWLTSGGCDAKRGTLAVS